MRVVSLLPAATDIVASLGRMSDLVGRTHECDWPAEVEAVPVVTRTDVDQDRLSSREISATVAEHRGSALYHLDSDLLAELEPDLVLTQDLCDVCALSYRRVTAAVRELTTGPRVLSLEPRTLDQVLDCLTTVGDALSAPSDPLITALRSRLAAIQAQVAGRTRPRVAAIEWLDPIWPAGHWVPEQISYAGGISVLAEPGQHTTPIPWQTVLDSKPDVVVLMPCGFPPTRTESELPLLTHLPGWSDLPAVWILDGPSYFNRPGPRITRGTEILAHILHNLGPPLTPPEAHRIR